MRAQARLPAGSSGPREHRPAPRRSSPRLERNVPASLSLHLGESRPPGPREKLLREPRGTAVLSLGGAGQAAHVTPERASLGTRSTATGD